MEMLEDCGGELQEFVSTCKGVFSSLVEKHFPVPNKKTKTIDIIGEMMSTSRSGSAAMMAQKNSNIGGGFHIQGDTATERLIWAFNRNSNQFLLILKLIIFYTYPIQLD